MAPNLHGRLIKLDRDRVTFGHTASQTSQAKLAPYLSKRSSSAFSSMSCLTTSSKFVTLVSLPPASTPAWPRYANTFPLRLSTRWSPYPRSTLLTLPSPDSRRATLAHARPRPAAVRCVAAYYGSTHCRADRRNLLDIRRSEGAAVLMRFTRAPTCLPRAHALPDQRCG